ncbi:hypothetical protein D9M70_519480 [compost metagenome]
MLDQCLECCDPHQTTQLAARIEEAYPAGEVALVEVAECDQGDRQEQEAQAQAAQQDGGHHVVGAALAGRTGQHPHRNHDHQDSKGHCGDRWNAAGLHEIGGHEERSNEQRATRQQELAGIGRREREDGQGERRNQERAPEQCGAGDKTDDESERKIARIEQGEVEQTLAFGQYLLAEKCQQSGCADHCQPQDAGLLEPVPAAALDEDVGETEQGGRNQ